MTGRDSTLAAITGPGVIGILRAERPDYYPQAAAALVSGGITAVEVTLTTLDALATIERVAAQVPDAIVGAGTVLRPHDAYAVMKAGARFIVSPIFTPEVVRIARENGVVVIPGTFTPTEVYSAWQAGADFVKVFPSGVYGPQHIRALHAVFPAIPLLPTSGPGQEDAGEYIAAGAVAIGIGDKLIDKAMLTTGDMSDLAERARALVALVARARQQD
jgi:2-dehydro-3-deoxyphosphogluconate aldolase/(4S)-4-hydroxy-2-oxoglutarate aldolase